MKESKLSLVLALVGIAFLLSLYITHPRPASTQEAVRVNVNIVDNTAENRNLDAFVAKFGCVIDANAEVSIRRAARRQCREAAILRFMEDVEQPGVAAPTPTPTPTPTPVPQ
jgi:hypothetical protein